MRPFCAKKAREMAETFNDKILVIDDERPVVDVIDRFLHHIGLENVDLCTSMDCFTDYFKPFKYQMIIVDLNLSANLDMSGFEIVRQIREMDHGVIVMVITGYPDSLINKQLISSGIDDFLLKPLTLETFSYRVLLNLSRARRQKNFASEIRNRYDDRIDQLKQQAVEINRRMADLFLGETHAGDGRQACSGVG